MYQTLLTDLQDGILVVTINRPDKLNALNKDVIEELGKVVDDIYQNPEIKTAILTGAGEKAFVAGADISEFTALDGNGGAAGRSRLDPPGGRRFRGALCGAKCPGGFAVAVCVRKRSGLIHREYGHIDDAAGCTQSKQQHSH